ncbi:MAG: hypothetical protein JNL01_15105 [Bdellovibrionales bacterium]|nr:hypothetical protein [Bdellovibrionales bacterium]
MASLSAIIICLLTGLSAATESPAPSPSTTTVAPGPGDPGFDENRKVFPAIEPREPKAKVDMATEASQKAKAKKSPKKKPKPKSTLLPDPVPRTAWGSTSNTEADLLWTDARQSFEASRFEDAFGKFKRLQDRYPGYSFYSLLPFWIGETALRLEDWEFARKQLRAFILNEPNSKASLSARFELSRVFVAKKQLNDAYLTSIEILNALKKVKLKEGDPAFEAAALLIRAEGLMAVNDWRRADLSVQSALKVMPKPVVIDPSTATASPSPEPCPSPSPTPSFTGLVDPTNPTAVAPSPEDAVPAQPEASPSPSETPAPPLPMIPELSIESLRIRASLIALRIAIHGCERYPTGKRLAEDQVLDQLDRRGDCLIQAFGKVRDGLRVKIESRLEETPQKILIAAVDRISGELLDTYQEAWARYFLVSDRPPDPIKPRTQQQLNQYRFELSDKLLQRAHLKRLQWVDLAKPMTSSDEGLSETRVRQVRTLLRSIEKMGRAQ